MKKYEIGDEDLRDFFVDLEFYDSWLSFIEILSDVFVENVKIIDIFFYDDISDEDIVDEDFESELDFGEMRKIILLVNEI